jgi:inhibitor of Bruton tyrosine kinase
LLSKLDFDLSLYCDSIQRSAKKTPKAKNRPSKSELTKRNYEIEGVRELQKEIKDLTIEPMSPKSPDSTIIEAKRENWQIKERERKDSAKKKLLPAAKCNEIMKSETQSPEAHMVDLKFFKTVEKSPEPESSRSALKLADFVISTKKKTLSLSESPKQVETKTIGWKMDNVELKIVNKNLSDPFKETKQSKNTGTIPKNAGASAEKNFVSIIKNERKEKDNYEKIKSKSLILTQIEEKAIADLENFYNCDHIFDEDIKIARKVQIASQNLSQWHAGLN